MVGFLSVNMVVVVVMTACKHGDGVSKSMWANITHWSEAESDVACVFIHSSFIHLFTELSVFTTSVHFCFESK